MAVARGLACGLATLALWAVMPGACGSTGSSVVEADAPQIGLRRGGRWSVLTLKPPHLSGPHFHLVLKDGVLSGSVSGGAAPGGSLRVKITPEVAEGFGPLGPVSIDFVTSEDSTVADGLWNGRRVHVVFAKDSLRGTVADNSDSLSRASPDAFAASQATGRSRRRGGFSPTPGTTAFDPLPTNSSCEYFLTELSSDGALNGGSICSGMPQQTRLEVPLVAQAWLTRTELATVLVALLSAPPVVAAEEMGPRFTDPTRPDPPPSGRRPGF